MVFLALVVAFDARRGFTGDWIRISLPFVLWPNTAILIGSSVCLEIARHRLRHGHRAAFNKWWTIATVMGFLFLAGQALAWKQLNAEGIFVASNPASSFFYVMTATHALHLIAALTALIYVDVKALHLQLGPAKRTVVDVSTIFWHFLDVIWLCLMALLTLWG